MDEIMIPEQAEAHVVMVDGYEEDFFLLENDMTIMKFFVGLGDFAYARRMLEWDMVKPYQWHKRQLQILWEQRSAKRWLLKCPWHLWNLRALDDALADQLRARIAEDPTAQLGEHDYDIADYGLTEDQIQDTFTDYRQRFGV